MQINNKYFNPEYHDQYFALSVKQPYAQDLVTALPPNENGEVYGVKSIEVRSKRTKFRGDILICSSKQPELIGYESGVTLGLAELYDCKPVQEFTDEDWNNTRIPKDERSKIKQGYGWLFRNPRRVVEIPIKGQLGIYKLTTPKGDITEYPQLINLDVE